MHVISRNCSIWAANFCVTRHLYYNATRNTAQESYFSRGLLILLISRLVACGRRKAVQCSARSDTYCISLQTVRADRSSSTSCTARRNSLVLWQFSYLGCDGSTWPKWRHYSEDNIFFFLLLWLHYPRRTNAPLVALLHPSLSCATCLLLTAPIFFIIFSFISCSAPGLYNVLAFHIPMLIAWLLIRCLCRYRIVRLHRRLATGFQNLNCFTRQGDWPWRSTSSFPWAWDQLGMNISNPGGVNGDNNNGCQMHVLSEANVILRRVIACRDRIYVRIRKVW